MTDNSPIDIYLNLAGGGAGSVIANDIPRNASEYVVSGLNLTTSTHDAMSYIITFNTPGDMGNTFVAQSEDFTVAETAASSTTDNGASASETAGSAAASSNAAAVLDVGRTGAAGWTLAGTVFALLGLVA